MNVAGGVGDPVNEPGGSPNNRWIAARSESTGHSFHGTCTNQAGLSTDATPVTVKLDKTAPSAVLTPAGTLGANGWYVDDVTVTTTGDDDISGPVSCTAAPTLDTDTVVHGSCANDAGLARNAEPITVKLDKSDPSAHLSVTHGALGAGNWYLDDVTVHTSGADNVSEPTTCTGGQYQTTDTDAAGHDFHGSCTNDAGRTQQAEPVNVKRDASAPTAHLEVLSGTSGDQGWYTSAVTVRTVGNDPQSGVTCTAVTAETTGTTVNGSCNNGAGITTEAAPVVIKIDIPGPAPTCTSPEAPRAAPDGIPQTSRSARRETTTSAVR